MAFFFDSIRAMHEEAVGSYAADIGFATDVPVSTVSGVPSSGGAALPLHHASLKRFVEGARLPELSSKFFAVVFGWEQCFFAASRPNKALPGALLPPARPRSFRQTAIDYRAVGNAERPAWQ